LIDIDLMPITLGADRQIQLGHSTINFTGNVDIEQGTLVAIVGESGCGKRTLLRLVSDTQILPSLHGTNVPSHLRLVNVSQRPLFYAGSLYHNLVYGLPKGDADVSPDRVRTICKRVGLPQEVLVWLENDTPTKWGDTFSGAQCKLICIARALVWNVELTCINKPLIGLTDAHSELVMGVLHEHVRHMGICTDITKQRPRTVIVSDSNRTKVEAFADQIVTLSSTSGLVDTSVVTV